MSNTRKLQLETMILKEPNKTLVLNSEENNEVLINKEMLLNNKYKIEKLLSDSSGEADIYLSSYNNEQFVAKIYRSNYKYKDEKIKKLHSLKSKYIISILEEGWINNRYFEVMPYYEKGDLTVNEIDEKFLIEVVVPNINDALEEIHDKGLVHRDIKPSNIYLSDTEDFIVLGDFGITSSLEEDMSIKKTSVALTEGYSGPEAYNGCVFKELDYYSLGITLLHLCTGQNPFQGMTYEQIFRITCFGNLNIPESINVRLAMLIKGLTIKDRNLRWGNNEVGRWINGESISIADNISNVLSKPYTINDKSVSTLEEIAYELAISWENGKKHFYRSYLENFFKDVNQELASKIRDCYNAATLDTATESKLDIEFFKVIYNIYPKTPLIWKGEELGDINGLISKVEEKLPYIDDSYKELIISGNLQFYLEKNNQPKEIIDVFNDITNLASASPDKAYFGFALLNNSKFKYDNQVFESINDLIKYFTNLSLGQEIEECCKRFIISDYFYMWMRKLGVKSEKLTNYLNWK